MVRAVRLDAGLCHLAGEEQSPVQGRGDARLAALPRLVPCLVEPADPVPDEDAERLERGSPASRTARHQRDRVVDVEVGEPAHEPARATIPG